MCAIFANNGSGCMESDILEKPELGMKEVLMYRCVPGDTQIHSLKKTT